jgi:UDP-glucose 4-epimerase
MKAFVTGSAGFFGGVLKDHLLNQGWTVAGADMLRDAEAPGYSPHTVDLRDRDAVTRVVEEFKPDAVFHCAAVLAHDRQNRAGLWSSNVDGTRHVVEAAASAQAKSLVFISSNCLWGTDFGRPIKEDDPPAPIEIYGRSKLQGEKIVLSHGRLPVKVLRCPTIVAAGRLGLLSILFDFIHEGRRVWVVGDGGNRYQFVAAGDLARACELLAQSSATGVFHVGSENVPTLRDMYGELIRRAGTRARVASLPRRPAVAAMRMLSALGLSPLGPYHYRMIASNFEFDTTRLRTATGWRPTLGNTDILWQAYRYYIDNRDHLSSAGASAHRKPSAMGALKLVKWLS